jgi:hypothetical protein
VTTSAEPAPTAARRATPTARRQEEAAFESMEHDAHVFATRLRWWLARVKDPEWRRSVAHPLVLYPATAIVIVVGTAEYGLLSLDDGLVFGLIWATLLVAVFVVPFIPIAMALRAGWIGAIGGGFAFVAGTAAALLAVPWLVDRSIANDSSSTASLIHVYDPVLDTVAVGAVLLVTAIARRFRTV